MLSFLVFGRRVIGAILFHEDEACWIVLLLNKIEAGDAGFFDTASRVLNSGFAECFKAFRLYLHVDVDD